MHTCTGMKRMYRGIFGADRLQIALLEAAE
jgi:hypothetical protein